MRLRPRRDGGDGQVGSEHRSGESATRPTPAMHARRYWRHIATPPPMPHPDRNVHRGNSSRIWIDRWGNPGRSAVPVAARNESPRQGRHYRDPLFSDLHDGCREGVGSRSDTHPVVAQPPQAALHPRPAYLFRKPFLAERSIAVTRIRGRSIPFLDIDDVHHAVARIVALKVGLDQAKHSIPHVWGAPCRVLRDDHIVHVPQR